MPLRVVLLGRLVFLVLMDFGVVALGDRLKSGLPNHGDSLSQAAFHYLVFNTIPDQHTLWKL
jgi:hypothetical protein